MKKHKPMLGKTDNVVLCLVMLFYDDATLLYRLQYCDVSY